METKGSLLGILVEILSNQIDGSLGKVFGLFPYYYYYSPGLITENVDRPTTKAQYIRGNLYARRSPSNTNKIKP
jgi:hypothetical protein